jgi:hypothetical protein
LPHQGQRRAVGDYGKRLPFDHTGELSLPPGRTSTAGVGVWGLEFSTKSVDKFVDYPPE